MFRGKTNSTATIHPILPSALPEISTENQLFRKKVYLILGALCQPFIKQQFFKANEFLMGCRDTTCKLHSLVYFTHTFQNGYAVKAYKLPPKLGLKKFYFVCPFLVPELCLGRRVERKWCN